MQGKKFETNKELVRNIIIEKAIGAPRAIVECAKYEYDIDLKESEVATLLDEIRADNIEWRRHMLNGGFLNQLRDEYERIDDVINDLKKRICDDSLSDKDRIALSKNIRALEKSQNNTMKKIIKEQERLQKQ